MRQAGVRMQVSAGDLLGGLFNKSAKVAKRLVAEGLADAVVTDVSGRPHFGLWLVTTA